MARSMGWTSGVVVWLLAGCIGDGRQNDDSQTSDDVDTLVDDTRDTDGATPDTTPDGTDADDATGVSDAGDAGVDGDATDTVDTTGPDTTPAQCAENDDCELVNGPAGQCESWYCDDGVCLTQPLSARACDDGDPCTSSDFCDDGVCAGGSAVRCDQFAPDCWSGNVTTCTPGVGCGGTFQAEGEPCAEATGPSGGACAQGWLVPNDTCDGEGHCLDKSSLVPPGIHPLAANWHLVVSNAESGRPHYTSRANLTLGASGGLTLTNPASTSLSWTASTVLGESGNPNIATYCASLEGEVVLRYASLEYSGRTDPNRRLMVLHGARDELGVALRKGGSPSSVNGIYRMVSTGQFGLQGDRLIVWQGQIGFTNGCVTVAGGFSTTPGLGDSYTYETGNDYCLTADGSNFRLPLRIRKVNSDDTFDIQWYGAIGPTGDLLLLTRDDSSAARLRYGTILLVRQRDAASVGSTAGSWDFAAHRGGARTSNDLASSAFLEFGRLELGPSTLELGGTVTRANGSTVTIGGAWWYPGTAGRYNQRYSLADAVVNHTGWISESSNVIVGWRVLDPEVDAGTPQNLSLVPFEGSLLVAVRWAPFTRPYQ
ncbi:MAG: hypothetical protein JNJ59_27695 [Deltaproteobacteria bacterium]|nr:hypothetical protein [Deltaproteobacteria bacterium]